MLQSPGHYQKAEAEVPKRMAPFHKGDRIAISMGNYSSYAVEIIGRVKKEFSPDDLVEQWFTLHPEQREPFNARLHGFLSWVVSQGYIEEQPMLEWHLGDYGCFNMSEGGIKYEP